MTTSRSVDDFEELFQRCSNWGRWGADDQRGALNYITPDHTRRAARLVQDGRSVSLSRPLATTPASSNPFPVTHLMMHAGDTVTGDDGFTSDYFAMPCHGISNTHLDALCHSIYRGRMFNGFPVSKVTSRAALAGNIEAAVDGVVSRGVLLDVPRTKGLDWLEPGAPIFTEDLLEAEEAAGITVGEGDVLLVRTGRGAREAAGHSAVRLANGRHSLSGLHGSTLPWLHERQIALLGADGISDVTPSGIPGQENPIHRGGITAIGLHLLDNAELEALSAACAERNRWEFQFMLAPLRLLGGTGSPVNPLAVF